MCRFACLCKSVAKVQLFFEITKFYGIFSVTITEISIFHAVLVFLLSCRRELLGGRHGLCYAFVIPLLNGHYGTKDGHFGMKVDKLAEIWDLARLLPFLG